MQHLQECVTILCTPNAAGLNIDNVNRNFYLCGWLWNHNSLDMWQKLSVHKTLIWRLERCSFNYGLIVSESQALPASFHTAQKMKFSIKNLFSKCDQFLRIWSHLLRKFLMGNFIFCAVSEILSDGGPEQIVQSQNRDFDEEKEIVLYKRHKKYFEEVQKATARVWSRTCQNKSLEFIRDMNLFMSRYSVNSEFVTKCDGCAACLPWQKYRCLDCFDIDLCSRCYLSHKQPNGHLTTHKMIELR